MTSHSDAAANNDDGAVVVSTIATVGDSIGGGAVAAADDTVIDGTVADTGSVKKQNFHAGPPLTHCGGRLDPVSRTNNSAQPTEFDAVATGTVDKVRCAQLSSLDTGSSPVWSAVADGDAGGDDRAAVVSTVATVGDGVGDGAVAPVTVTDAGDATIAADGDNLKSSFRQDAGIQTQGQQNKLERGG